MSSYTEHPEARADPQIPQIPHPSERTAGFFTTEFQFRPPTLHTCSFEQLQTVAISPRFHPPPPPPTHCWRRRRVSPAQNERHPPPHPPSQLGSMLPLNRGLLLPLISLLLLLPPFVCSKFPLSSHRQTPKNIPSFSLSTHNPVSIPLRVTIVRLGFDGTGQYAVSLNPVDLEEYAPRVLVPVTLCNACVRRYLYTVLPTRQPHDLNTGRFLHAE